MKTPTVFRLTRQLLIITISAGLFLLFFIGLPLFSTKNFDTEIIVVDGIFFLILGVPGLLCLYAYIHCRITASQNGMEIRGMFYRRKATWDEISDFYFQLMPSGRMAHAYIEFGGRKQILSHNFENRPALLECIEQNATNARTRKFEFKEARDLNENPIVFDYGNPKIWPLVLTAFALGLLQLGNLFFNAIGGVNRFVAVFALYSWPMKLGFVALPLCFCALYPLMILAFLPPIKTLQKYKDQQIIASKTGLEWRNGANKTQILWEQIQNYYQESVPGHLQSSLCVVESERERIAFLDNIPKGAVLRLLIKQKATDASVSEWKFATGHDVEILAKSSLVNSDGSRVFHYKTRTTRAMLLGGTAICLILVLMGCFGNQIVGRQDSSPLYIAGFISIPVIYGWITYFSSRLVIEPAGIRSLTIFGKKFIAWNEVQGLKTDLFYSITGRGNTIRAIQYLAEPALFKTTVAQHSGKAWTPEASDAAIKR